MRSRRSRPLSSLLNLGFLQRGEVGERRLLLAGVFGGQRSEAFADRGQVKLTGVPSTRVSSAWVFAGALTVTSPSTPSSSGLRRFGRR